MKIFLGIEGRRTGPYSPEDIQTKLLDGTASPSDLAWHEGLAGWLPLSEVLNIPPPIPTAETATGNIWPRQSTAYVADTSGARMMYLYIPVSRLIWMTYLSFGTYQAYWVYRNWRFIRDRRHRDISPFWRGIFSFFFIYSLFKTIKQSSSANRILPARFSPNLAIAWIVTRILASLFARLLGPVPGLIAVLVSLSAVFFLVPVQRYINSIHEASGSRPEYYRFSAGHVVCLVFGLIAWAFTIIGTIAMITQAAIR